VAIKISSDGAENILKYMTGVITTTETLSLKLFSSNTTPGPLTVLGDFTEVTGGGYAAKSLSAAEWTVTGNSATSTSQLFTFTSNIGLIYGYYLVGATSGKLIASERFISGPYNIAASGDTLTVTATISIA
jgi:hypothetical protein